MSDAVIISAAWQQVKCADCGREYRCTPTDDYYHRPTVDPTKRTLTNGVCEPCLVGDLRVVEMP
jgi:hypothetical protein